MINTYEYVVPTLSYYIRYLHDEFLSVTPIKNLCCIQNCANTLIMDPFISPISNEIHQDPTANSICSWNISYFYIYLVSIIHFINNTIPVTLYNCLMIQLVSNLSYSSFMWYIEISHWFCFSHPSASAHPTFFRN